MRAIALVALLLLVALSIAVGALSATAVQRQVTQPVSVTDAVMLSRQTPPKAEGGRGGALWFGVALALGAGGLGAFYIFRLRYAADYYKQRRLAANRPSRPPGLTISPPLLDRPPAVQQLESGE